LLKKTFLKSPAFYWGQTFSILQKRKRKKKRAQPKKKDKTDLNLPNFKKIKIKIHQIFQQFTSGGATTINISRRIS
jgi:hypothetical protein